MIATAFVGLCIALMGWIIQGRCRFESHRHTDPIERLGFWLTFWMFFFGSCAFIGAIAILLWRHFE